MIAALASAQGKSHFPTPALLPFLPAIHIPTTKLRSLITAAASDTIVQEGDIAVESLWRFEDFGIRIDIYTQLSVDCKFSTLETGLLGLADLILWPGGVGPVAADFTITEDGLGEVASGRLKLLGSYASAVVPSGVAEPVPTLIEVGATKTVTLVGGVVETGGAENA